MFVVTGGRQSGKTEQLIEWVCEKPRRTIAVHNQAELERLKRVYHLFDSQVRTFDGVRSSQGQPPWEVAFDNVEFILRRFTGPSERIALVAMNGPDDDSPAPLEATKCGGPINVMRERHSGGIPSPGWSGPAAGLSTQVWN